jgi:hypothetical protein
MQATSPNPILAIARLDVTLSHASVNPSPCRTDPHPIYATALVFVDKRDGPRSCYPAP